MFSQNLRGTRTHIFALRLSINCQLSAADKSHDDLPIFEILLIRPSKRIGSEWARNIIVQANLFDAVHAIKLPPSD